MKKLIFHSLIASILMVGSRSSTMAQDKFNRTDVTYLSSGVQIKGWLFMPADATDKKWPAIVMAPGFSGIKTCNYQFFAANFTRAGFAVLLFDYPNFGESAGEPRQEANPWQQVQAYRDGISFVETIASIDPDRIGIWGGSYAGGHVLVAAATDPRIKCVVAMTPFISGSFYVKHKPAEQTTFLYQQFQGDRLSRLKGGSPALIPVAGSDQIQFTAISSPYAWAFIQSFKDTAPTYVNQITLKSLEMQLEYEPGYYVQDIGPKPKLFIIAKDDELIPETLILDAYNKAAAPKKLVYLKGNHFSPYMEKLQEASDLAIDWFVSNL